MLLRIAEVCQLKKMIRTKSKKYLKNIYSEIYRYSIKIRTYLFKKDFYIKWLKFKKLPYPSPDKVPHFSKDNCIQDWRSNPLISIVRFIAIKEIHHSSVKDERKWLFI